jgi:hypothetical protein
VRRRNVVRNRFKPFLEKSGMTWKKSKINVVFSSASVKGIMRSGEYQIRGYQYARSSPDFGAVPASEEKSPDVAMQLKVHLLKGNFEKFLAGKHVLILNCLCPASNGFSIMMVS